MANSIRTSHPHVRTWKAIYVGTISYGNQGPCANFGNYNTGHWIPIRGHRSELGTFSFRRPPHPPTCLLLSQKSPLTPPFRLGEEAPFRFRFLGRRRANRPGLGLPPPDSSPPSARRLPRAAAAASLSPPPPPSVRRLLPRAAAAAVGPPPPSGRRLLRRVAAYSLEPPPLEPRPP